VAAENRQLLHRERERAVLEAELRDARVLLAERGGQLRALIARQETERGQLSSELYDDAAQVLAAVLMGLKALETQLGATGDGSGAHASWQVLRSDINSTLQLLRALAISLRPPVLRLGLRAALEDLAENMCSCGLGKCEIDLDPEIALDPELETMVYRIVEEALEAIEPPRTIRVHHTPDGVLVVDAQGSDNEFDSDRMRILTARVELIGGTVTASPNALSVRIWPTAVRRPAVRRAPATG
jgi:signal transduction histidine kinase